MRIFVINCTTSCECLPIEFSKPCLFHIDIGQVYLWHTGVSNVEKGSWIEQSKQMV